MNDSLYQEIILDHYHNPHNFGQLPKHTAKTKVNNPLCGDVITMEVRIVDGVLDEIAFGGEGCAISKASASLLTDFAKGKKADVLKKLSSADAIELLGISLSPNRLKCALLSWEALMKVLK